MKLVVSSLLAVCFAIGLAGSGEAATTGVHANVNRVMLNPQPLPPGSKVMLNPQPLPPGGRAMLNPQPLPPRTR
ncbi:MAG: hypothetical protein IT562_23900 [Alphaproteobacteria bacterium]|nr:hypothetical protein [Alphaproteobacteria bacterium]